MVERFLLLEKITADSMMNESVLLAYFQQFDPQVQVQLFEPTPNSVEKAAMVRFSSLEMSKRADFYCFRDGLHSRLIPWPHPLMQLIWNLFRI